jgi:hypothetical protein
MGLTIILNLFPEAFLVWMAISKSKRIRAYNDEFVIAISTEYNAVLPQSKALSVMEFCFRNILHLMARCHKIICYEWERLAPASADS